MRIRPSTARAVAAGILLLALPQCGPRSYGPFDGSNAREHTAAILEHGPRPSGSAAIRAVADTIEQRLREVAPGLELRRQRFVKPEAQKFLPDPEVPLEFENLWVEIPGEDPERGPILAIAAHYDSKRTWPEQGFEFVGALDSAASCGVLIELARVLTSAERPFRHDIWLIFFDGEESIPWDWDRTETASLVGSQHFAKTMNEDAERFPDGLAARMRVLVLLDLLGDHELKIDRDLNSTKALNDIFKATADAMGVGDIVHRERSEMTDDHLPFKRLGVKVIDLIDFQYRSPLEHERGVPEHAQRYFPFWHTPDDNLERVSAESLDLVGNLVLRALDAIEEAFYR